MSKLYNRYSDCVVSTRVRLARNLSNYPFSTSPLSQNNLSIIDQVVRTLKPLGQFDLILMNQLEGTQAEYLKDKYIVSPFLAKNVHTGGVVISEDEAFSIMINEEDHLREQCVLEGFCLDEAYDNLRYIDKKLSERMSFARDKDFGYITACMTNLGTGMRASVMLFLPALTSGGKIRALVQEMKELGLTVRGVYGEGSIPEGCFYQVSNEVTLGYSEEEILKMVSFAARKLCDMEIAERNLSYSENPLKTEDACMRAYGILSNCKLLSYDEFAGLFSSLALGSYYGFISLDIHKLYQLFLNMRPAILSYARGAETVDEGEALRAEIVSSVISGRR